MTKLAEQAVNSPSHNPYKEELAACRETLGRVLSDLGKDEESKAAFELSLTVYQQLAHDFGLREYQERLAVCRSHYGQLLHKLKDHDAAKAAFESADRSLAQLVDQYPDASSYQDERAFVQRHLGLLLWAMNEKTSAESAFAAAREIWQSLIADDPQPEYCDHLAWFIVNCPISELRDFEVAVEYASQAAEATEANGKYQTTLGAALYRQGHLDAATSTLRKADQPSSVDDGRISFYKALTFWDNGQHEQASAAFKVGIERMETCRPGNLELWSLRNEVEKQQKPLSPTD